jgi:hypothetical protein
MIAHTVLCCGAGVYRLRIKAELVTQGASSQVQEAVGQITRPRRTNGFGRLRCALCLMLLAAVARDDHTVQARVAADDDRRTFGRR